MGDRRGYSKDAHDTYPGVTISQETRDGRKVLLLRWREVLPGGRQGKRKACYALNTKGLALLKAGQPAVGPGLLATSRSKARKHAIQKSAELASERTYLAEVQPSSEVRPDATWTELEAAHLAYLSRKSRRAATLRAYGQAWAKVRGWPARPTLPRQLTLLDLETYRDHLSRKGLSPHSVNSLLVHFKAALNFGRTRVRCIRLDDVDVKQGLEPVEAVQLPVCLDRTKLRAILAAASAFDDEHIGAQTFPILAFVMVTGCRLGEMQALRWAPSRASAAESWPDFTGGMLRIYGAKTSVPRSLPFATRPGLRRLLGILRSRVDAAALPFVFGGTMPLAVRDRREAGPVEADGKRTPGRSAKSALAAVREASGADWAIKDLRSTAATHLANTSLYGSLLNTLADHLGHSYDVLKEHYLGKLVLPDAQRNAATVEEVLGVADAINAWCEAAEGKGGKLLRMRGA